MSLLKRLWWSMQVDIIIIAEKGMMKEAIDHISN